MKKKCVLKRILSAFLSVVLAVGTMPTGQLVSHAAPKTDAASTQANVDLMLRYADQLIQTNNRDAEGQSYADGKFTWDTESKSESWRYFNGVMLDAFMMLENMDSDYDDGYADYVKKFYDDLIVKDGDGTYSVYNNQYLSGELDSVPMSLAMFDLLNAPFSIESEYTHNFTENGLNSDFFTIAGELYTGTNSVVYNNTTYTQALKMDHESSTYITFTAPESGKLVIVAGTDGHNEIEVNNLTDDKKAEYTFQTSTNTSDSNAYVLELNVEAGKEYQIVRHDEQALLYYVALIIGESVAPTATPTAATPTPTPAPTELAKGTYTHSFTASDKTSDYFNITGDLSTGYESATYNGTTYTKCLKMGSSASITFVTTDTTKVTLVFNEKSKDQHIKVDGTEYIISEENNYVVEVSLSAGSHSIVRISGEQPVLFYIEVVVGETEEEPTTPDVSDVPQGTKLTNPVTTFDNNGTTTEIDIATVSADGTIEFVKDSGYQPYGVQYSNPLYGKDLAGITVSYWIKVPNDFVASENSPSLFGFYNSATSEYSKLYINGKTSYFSTGSWEKALSKPVDYTNVNYKDDEYNLVTYAISDTGSDFYLNGVKIDKQSDYDVNGSLAIDIVCNSSLMYIGPNSSLSFWNIPPLGTKIKDISTYETALTADQIKAIYNAATTTEVASEEVSLASLALNSGIETFTIAYSDKAKYEAILEFVYSELGKQKSYSTAGGNYLHKQDADGNPPSGWDYFNIGLDGIYMAQPFLMQYANYLPESNALKQQIYSDVYTRLHWIAENMYDNNTGLYYHGWHVETTDSEAHPSEQFWARGIGWYAVALVEAIDAMPDSAEKTQLIADLVKLFDGMLVWQDANTGMWTNIVNREEKFTHDTNGNTNKLETSGSSMMAYALMKAYLKGYVSAEYGLAGLKAFNGTVENKVTETAVATTDETATTQTIIAVSDIYQKSGVAPLGDEDYYLNNEYKADEAKGTGALLMATTLATSVEAELTKEGVSTANETVLESVGNPTNGVTVSGSGATDISVQNLQDNANIAVAVDGILADGYKAVKITLFGDDLNAATVGITLPSGVTSTNYVVYEYTSSGELVEVVGTLEGSTFYFKTDDVGTYVIGAKFDWDEMEWIGVNYKQTNKLDTEAKHIIVQANANGGGCHAWGRIYNGVASTNTEAEGTKFSISINETSLGSGLYAITTVDEGNIWYFDEDGRLYVKGIDGNADSKYYLGDGYLTNVLDNSYVGWRVVDPGDSVVKANAVYIVTDDSEGEYLKSDSKGLYITDGTNYSGQGGQYQFYIYSPASEVAFDGITEYTIYEGETTITDELIKQNATIYYRESDSETPVEVDWSDYSRISCSWSPSNGQGGYDYKTAGTYTMTVKFNQITIGEITVTVKEIADDSVTDITNKPYYLVQELEPNREYVIALSSSDLTYAYFARWSYDENKSVDLSRKTSEKLYDENGQEFSLDFLTKTYLYGDTSIANLSGVAWYNTWYTDADCHLYTKDNSGNQYYLNIVQDTNGLNTLALETTGTTVWTAVEENEAGGSRIHSGDVYLKIGSGGISSASATSSQGVLDIWSKSTTVKVTMQGTTSYSINKDDKTLTEESIKDNLRILALDSAGNASNISVNDPAVKYSWSGNALDTSTPGTYTMIVSYAGEEIGRVSVTVNDLTWKEISKEVSDGTEYTTVKYNEISIGQEYIFRNRNKDEGATKDTIRLNVNSVTVTGTTLTERDPSTNEASEHYTGVLTNTEGIDASQYSWVFEKASDNGYYIKNGEYYLKRGDKFTDSYDFYLSATKTQAEATVWYLEDGTDTNNPYRSIIYCIVPADETSDGTEKQYAIYFKDATYDNDGNLQTAAYPYCTVDNKNDKTIAIWSKITEVTSSTEAALSGTLSYDVKVGDTSITEQTVKTNAEIIECITSGDTVTTEEIAWDDSTNVVYSWTSTNGLTSLDTSVPGVYTMTVNYKGIDIGSITVNVEDTEIVSKEVTGNDTIYTSLGREPDLGNISVWLTYNDGTVKEVAFGDGITVMGYDVNTPGKQTASIYYAGELVGTVDIVVSENPYEGLDPAETPYPQYPDDGAVRIKKNATNEDFLFNNTGVTKVELDVAGVSEPKGLDVVLIVDVSNSMSWTDSWFENYSTSTDPNGVLGDKDKIPYQADGTTPDVDAKDKLDQAMEAAQSFATILLEDNTEDLTTNNTLSFVTFAGYDHENYNPKDSGYGSNADSVMTVFSGVENSTLANTSFANTKFTAYEPNSDVDYNNVGYKLKIADVNGNALTDNTTKPNRGNTNYDYGFSEAERAVKELQSSIATKEGMSYDETGRQTVVVFMTDGAPSHYNGYAAGRGANEKLADRIYGTTVSYSGDYSNVRDQSTWTPFIYNSNTAAQSLSKYVDQFFAVGFDLDHGGFGDHSWTAGDLKPVLENVAGRDSTGAYNVDEVVTVSKGAKLVEFYTDLANQLKLSGNYAKVTDIIKSDFTLQMGTSFTHVEEIDDANAINTTVTGSDGKAIAPVIEVNKYNLVTKEEVNGTTITADMIGSREALTGDELLEQVTFNDAGTEAYSSVLGAGHNIMTITTDESGNITSTVIEAMYFTYTKDANGVETFEWNIGDIGDDEVSLSYYVYLKGAKYINTAPPDDVYDTNESAILEYVDINGDYAVQTFPVPNRAWGTAVTTIEYYLVDEDGNLVNWAGAPIESFENRIIIDEETYTQQFRWGDTLKVYGAEHLPSGYKMYNHDAYYTVVAYETGDDAGSLVINDNKTTPDDAFTNASLINQGYTTQRVDNDLSNIGSTRVAFAVIRSTGKDVSWNLGEDRIVIDYGKPIQEDVLENNTKIADSGYTVEIVGLRMYDPDPTFITKTQSDPGVDSIETYYGNVEVLDDKRTVQFTPNQMVPDVIKLFTVAKVTEKAATDNWYYLYQPLYIIPATSVYYETNFASDVFTMAQSTTTSTSSAWADQTDSVDSTEATDKIQDDGSIGYNQTYGYDSTYLDDHQLSDGHSYFVQGSGKDKTTASFSFTGSGFDIISRTGENQGMIRVTAYYAGTKTVAKRMSVLNRSDSTWGELYQIPVISMEMDKHGTYDVVIDVYDEYTYDDPDFAFLDRDNDFYFDAVRVFDPIDVSSTTLYTDLSTVEAANQTDAMIALNAYAADGEAYETVEEVRDKLIKAGDFDVSDKYNTNGVIFIEKPDNDHLYEIADYEDIGPNNEVYLAKGQAIVFQLTGLDVNNIASIDIGAKAVDGATPTLKAVISKSLDALDPDTKVIETDIKSTTAQNYQLISGKAVTVDGTVSTDIAQYLASDGTAYVYITNATTDTTSTYNVLSITDIKIAYKGTPTITNSNQLMATSDLIGFANTVMSYEPDADVYTADVSEDQVKLFSKVNIFVETERTVENLNVQDAFGKTVAAETSYETQIDGNKLWTVTVTVTRKGINKYKVTGYAEDGSAGESISVSVDSSIKKGGGWQDAKNIFKTLFNSRIFSIERSSGSKLRGIGEK